MEGSAASGAAGGDRLLTRFLVYSTPDMGVTLNLVGDYTTTSRDTASRKYFEEHPDESGELVIAAISENAIKLRIPPPKIGIGLSAARAEEPRGQLAADVDDAGPTDEDAGPH